VRRGAARASSGTVLTILLIFLEGEFYIIEQIVIGGPYAKLIRRPIPYHKTIQLIPPETGDPEDDRPVEPVVYILVMFLLHQPLLERQRPMDLTTVEHLDQAI
jgi:hypothetical protein